MLFSEGSPKYEMILTLKGRLAPTPRKMRLWEGHFQDIPKLTIRKTLSDFIISIFDHRHKIIGHLFNILTILDNIWTILENIWIVLRKIGEH